jgi:hypothetical protein
MKMFKHGLFALLIALIASASLAQTQTEQGANGGQLVTSQGHPMLVFYINDDDGSPLSTKQMRGRATVQDRGRTSTVPLEPAAPNMMIGRLQAPLGSKARVVFSANLHGHSLTARYVTE